MRKFYATLVKVINLWVIPSDNHGRTDICLFITNIDIILMSRLIIKGIPAQNDRDTLVQ